MSDLSTAEIPAHLAVIGPVKVTATTVQTFLFSAATWNPHRIHYDREYAIEEGYPDVLVQAHLHGSFLCKAVLDVAGARARLTRFGWQNRGIACPGQTMAITGRAVASRTTAAGEGVVEGAVEIDYELEERHVSGDLAATAWATVVVPADGFHEGSGSHD